MVREGNTRATFSIPEELDTDLNAAADEWNMNRSEIVREALREYLDQDKLARVEHKLDQVLDAVSEGGTPTPSETTSKKEKSSSESSEPDENLPAPLLSEDEGGPKEKRANKMFNTLIREYQDTAVISKPEIVDAIETVWGDATDHMLDEYIPKLEQRLKDAGCNRHVSKPHVWYLDDEAYEDHVQSNWESVETAVAEGEPDPMWDVSSEMETIQRAIEEGEEMKQTVLETGVESKSEVSEVLQQGREKLGQTGDNDLDEVEQAVVDAISELGGEATLSEISEETGYPGTRIYTPLMSLTGAVVAKTGSGASEEDRYELL